MRARDLKKLKPGQKLVTRLNRTILTVFPALVKWNDRIVYFDHASTSVEDFGYLMVRSSHKVRKSTTYELVSVREVTVVHDLNTAVFEV